MGFKYVAFIRTPKYSKHKFVAIFLDKTKRYRKEVKFGQKGAEDYTIHKDYIRKINYLKRHKPNEDWNDYTSAGALSRWILWNKLSLGDAIRHYMKKFKLEPIK